MPDRIMMGYLLLALLCAGAVILMMKATRERRAEGRARRHHMKLQKARRTGSGDMPDPDA